MQAQPSIASKFAWVRTLFLICLMTMLSASALYIVTDDSADNSCGGG